MISDSSHSYWLFLKSKKYWNLGTLLVLLLLLRFLKQIVEGIG